MHWFKRWLGPLIFTVAVSCVPLREVSASPASDNKSAQSNEAKYFDKNCSACHSIGTAGGCLGPVLAGEGQRRTKAFIESRISSDPAKVADFNRVYAQAELMPHKRIPPADAKKMAEYVISLPSAANGFAVKGHTTNGKKPRLLKQASSGMATILHGKKLVYEKGCLQCHSFRGFGGQFGPLFDGIASRHEASYIAGRITAAELLDAHSDSEYNERGIAMPPLGLTEKEISDITAYLSSLK